MPLQLAVTPSQALRACHPETPVPAGDERYVDVAILRGSASPVADQFSFLIEAENGSNYVKGLVTGHRGNGKTSELLRLKQRLEAADFFVVYFDIEGEIGLSDVKGSEIITLLAEKVVSAARDEDLPISGHVLQELYGYFAQRTLTEVNKTAADLGLSASAEIGATMPFMAKLLAKITAAIKFSSERKVEVRREISLNFSEFTLRLNRLIEEASSLLRDRLGKAGLVIIADGLEKLAYEVDAAGVSNYEAIFVRNADQLIAPACHTIYTVPISLAYDQGLWGVWPDSVYVMPMLNMRKPQASALVREILARRLDLERLFESLDDVDLIVRTSGGCMRDLMFLTRQACGPGDKITTEQVRRSIIGFQQGYDRLISETDMPVLYAVMESGSLEWTGSGRQLLDKRVVLEYLNESRWISVHPGISESASFQRRLQKYRSKVIEGRSAAAASP